MQPMPNILVRIPPAVQYAITAIGSLVSLFATQGLITNANEKLIAGTASIVIPLAYIILVAALHAANARVTAARIMAGQPTTPRIGP